MAVGLKAAGYSITWANDFDKRACQAYAANIGDHIVHGDITAIDPDDIPDADVIAGGPPCQDYSVAGTGAGEEGERGRLVWTYLKVIERKKPKAFVFENVKGLVSKRHRPTFDALLTKFDEIGYEVSWRVINAWDYGVAQKRERVFIVGIRKDLGFAFEFPEPSPDEYRSQVLRDVIGDLPEPLSNERNPADGSYSSQFLSRNRVVSWNDASFTVLTNPRDISIHPADGTVSMGSVRNHNDKSFWTPNHLQTRSTTVKPSDKLSNQRGYTGDLEKPGRTVNTSRLDHAEIHPQAPRRFTVRECLRIQSVPDWYVLPDDISLSAQYRIVGNGVASRVAYVLGIALAQQLKGALGIEQGVA